MDSNTTVTIGRLFGIHIYIIIYIYQTPNSDWSSVCQLTVMKSHGNPTKVPFQAPLSAAPFLAPWTPIGHGTTPRHLEPGMVLHNPGLQGGRPAARSSCPEALADASRHGAGRCVGTGRRKMRILWRIFQKLASFFRKWWLNHVTVHKWL